MPEATRTDSERFRVAEVIADLLAARGVDRIFGLTGGHTKPLWDALSRRGVKIVHVRHEAAAVHMAHAAAELSGHVAVATVTCGPGVANAVTGVATAQAAGVPVLLIAGLPPRPQLGRGAFEELAQTELMRPVTRLAATLRDPDHVVAVFDEAWRRAEGWGGAPGPVFIDVPVDVLRSPTSTAWVPNGARSPAPDGPVGSPLPQSVERAAGVLRDSRRPVVVTGRPVRGSEAALREFLDVTGALHLETRDTRGIIAEDHPASVPAARRRLMAEADTIVTVGRRLDYELAYGSPAVFSSARRFVRIGTAFEELHENRPATVAVAGDVRRSLGALVGAGPTPTAPDRDWFDEISAYDRERRTALSQRLARLTRSPGEPMHPLRLVEAINTVTETDDIVVADGGDILSFAGVALSPRRLLHPGAFGCLGVGIPFGVGASLAMPSRRVLVLTGDGALGFNALELHTAAQYGAPVVVVVANNQAWNIERHDRVRNYDNDLFSTELEGANYALLAQSLGITGERVEHSEDLEPALQRALAAPPALVEVMVSGEPLSPDFKAGLAEIGDHQALRAWNDAELAYRGGHGQRVGTS